MTNTLKTAIIYVPCSDDASDERWDIVAASLRAAGVQDIRPAPMPCQQYTPRQMRRAPVLLCSAEV
jgi:hypothetical protein